MRKILLSVIFGGLACAAALQAQPDENGETDESNSAQADRRKQIERGRYLVHDVAQCVQCHTPRNDRGELVERRLLRGAAIPVRSPYNAIPWAFESPQLAGLPGWSEEEIATLLRTGRRPNGYAPRPPMPTFKMIEQDASAVAAYLMSLRE